MDMAVANLFKRKISFKLKNDSNFLDRRWLEYNSERIENAKSIDVRDANELRLKSVEPFIIHVISTFVNEERYHIKSIDFRVTIFDSDLHSRRIYVGHPFLEFYLNKPKKNLPLFSSKYQLIVAEVPKNLIINGPFFIRVNITIAINYGIIEWIDFITEEENQVHDSYRQDHCVVCLESKPNILYFDCMHIAICDSCDRLKKTERKNCDVCRAVISKRIKI